MHAIGAGVLLAEIQQMSDATFRIYDWGRKGPDGKPRQLHLQVSRWNRSTSTADRSARSHAVAQPIPGGGTRERLAQSHYFALRTTDPVPADARGRPRSVHDCDGFERERRPSSTAGIASCSSSARHVLLPAALNRCEIAPRGEATVLTCVVP